MNMTRIKLTALATLLVSGCAALDTPSVQTHRAATSTADALAGIESLQAPAAGNSSDSATDITADSSFWEQLRSGLRLSGNEHATVSRQITKYSNHPGDVARLFRRGEPYLAYILGEVEKRGFPAEIALLPAVESGYDPFAYSHGRAAGLWQFIPATGKRYGLKQDWWYDGRRDVVASTEAALDYLERLHRQFDGDWLLALAAYNSGEGTVARAIRKNRKAGKPEDFWHLRLPKETAAYVPRLLAISAIVRDLPRHGIQLPPLSAEPRFAVIDTRGQLDIGIAAELAGIDMEALYQLNPGFNRWATHPDGPHRLAIPVEKASAFEQNLAALPASKRIKWVRHKIQGGETLSHIASHYQTTVAVLRSTNELASTNIRAGRHLLVPVAAKDPSRYAALKQRLHPARKSGTKLTYQVRNGDNLWTIARKHKVSVNQVTRWNRLDRGSLIKPGQKLVIWQSGGKAGSGKRVRSVSYKVRSGDSLYRISKKFNVSIADLRRWNNLPRDKHLQPGQHLKLYVDVTRLTEKSHG